MTTSANKTKCEELQEALDAARAAIESPREHADTDMAGTVDEVGATDAESSVQPELMKQIEDIQQAMRDAGCL
jgi:hypothetical protein